MIPIRKNKPPIITVGNADHKEEVIRLLKKVTTTSLETMKLISQMETEKE